MGLYVTITKVFSFQNRSFDPCVCEARRSRRNPHHGLDAPYVAAPHHGLDAPLHGLDAPF